MSEESKKSELTILDTFVRNKRGYANCLCSCGQTKTIRLDSVESGTTRSCGHLLRKASGLSKSPTYRSYQSMKQRCYNKNHEEYPVYGGRGIIVCKRWLESFNNFVEDVGVRPSLKYSIDRIDNDGVYEPTNCKWSTRTEQSNNASYNRVFEVRGVRRTATQLAREYGLASSTLWNRLRRGLSIIDALETPLDIKQSQNRRKADG